MVQVDEPKTKVATVQKAASKEKKDEGDGVSEKETAETEENTHKWATAVLETKPKKDET